MDAAGFDFIQDDLEHVPVKNMHAQRFNAFDSG